MCSCEAYSTCVHVRRAGHVFMAYSTCVHACTKVLFCTCTVCIHTSTTFHSSVLCV